MDKVLGAYATPKNRKHNRARRGSHTIRQFSSLVRFGGFLVAACAVRGWRVPGFARQRVGTTALTRTHFLLLYAAMLVAASGNTALQSVMPAIGREIGISDFWVAVAYTWSAVLWVLLAPYLGGEERPSRPQGADPAGPYRIHRFDILCGTVLLHLDWLAAIGGGLTFILFGIFRAIYGALGSATPSATQAYLAAKTRRSGRVAALVGSVFLFRARNDHRPGGRALVRPAVRRTAGPMFAFSLIALTVFTSILLWLPNDRYARRIGRGAAMSYPSGASQPTGASVVAATSPKRQTVELEGFAGPPVDPCRRHGRPRAGGDPDLYRLLRDRPAGAGAARIGGLDRDRDDGRSFGDAAAQWGLIPRLGLKPRALILWGSLDRGGRPWPDAIVARDLYGITFSFALASLGFGFTRPGFTGGASLAVPLVEQGSVAGRDHRGERHQLGRRSGAWNGALSGQPEPAVRDFVAAACRAWRSGREPTAVALASGPLPSPPRERSMPGSTKPMPVGAAPLRSSASSGCAHIPRAFRA